MQSTATVAWQQSRFKTEQTIKILMKQKISKLGHLKLDLKNVWYQEISLDCFKLKEFHSQMPGSGHKKTGATRQNVCVFIKDKLLIETSNVCFYRGNESGLSHFATALSKQKNTEILRHSKPQGRCYLVHVSTRQYWKRMKHWSIIYSFHSWSYRNTT